jgi:phosphoenolpyruvate phosphomutase
LKASQQLRKLLCGESCEQILEAHNALSATIVEAAGVPGIWASSLTLSCSNGLRDNSELTMTQALEILESMTARVEIPILFDGDTGYGHFNHFQQLVRRLCSRQVAGVCIEDKVFPKTNSFLHSEQQELAPIEEFCGKIRAGKDCQTDPDFVLVARTEALITGLDVGSAIERAERYVEAGADAVLVQSKDPSFAPIQEFMQRFGGAAPVICVPTTYYSTPREAFERAGVALVIWANQMLRASVEAMQRVATRIAESGSARDVEDFIVPVKELFRLQDADGLSEIVRTYGQNSPWKAVVLAASRGEGLDTLTTDRPKCMIPIGGVPVIEKLVQHLRAEGVRDISIVRGYCGEALSPEGATYYDNPRWQQTGELASLAAARTALKGDVVFAYGDLIFKRYILHELMTSDAVITLVVDVSKSFLETGRRADRVKLSAPPPSSYDEGEYSLTAISANLPDAETHGEWIGLARSTTEGTELLHRALDEILDRPGGDQLDMSALFTRLIESGTEIRASFVQRDWIDINGVQDVAEGNTR